MLFTRWLIGWRSILRRATFGLGDVAFEKRAALAGVARPKSQTPKRWFPRLIEANESERASMEQFIAQQYRRLYAPSILQSSQGEQTDEVYVRPALYWQAGQFET